MREEYSRDPFIAETTLQERCDAHLLEQIGVKDAVPWLEILARDSADRKAARVLSVFVCQAFLGTLRKATKEALVQTVARKQSFQKNPDAQATEKEVIKEIDIRDMHRQTI